MQDKFEILKSFAKHYSLALMVIDVENKQDLQLATGVIIKKEDKYYLCSAAHVFEDFLKIGVNGRLQIGLDKFTYNQNDSNRICISKKYDFGVLEITANEVEENKWPYIESNIVSNEDSIVGERIIFYGFPGDYKELELIPFKVNVRGFYVYGEIVSVEYDQFSVRTDNQRYIFKDDPNIRLTQLGGMSGAPIFGFENESEKIILKGWMYQGEPYDNLTHKYFALLSKAFDQVVRSIK